MLFIIAGFANAQSVGRLEGGELVPTGLYAIVRPPEGLEEGKPIVRISAPRTEWILDRGGFYKNEPDCRSALFQARADAASLRLEALETSILAKENKALAHEQSVKADVLAVTLDNSRCEQSDGSELFRTRQTISRDIDAPYER
jgi:hypothetical protein